MLSCREATRLVARSMEQRLTWKERLALRFHLMMCDVCRRYRDQLIWLDRTLAISFRDKGREIN